MGPILLLLMAAAPQPAGAHLQAVATARIVSGQRIRLTAIDAKAGASKPVPWQRSRIRRTDGHGSPTELRLAEFQ
jgi:hypothetical protein